MFSFLLTVADCGGIEVLKVLKFVWSLLDLVFIFVPIGLIVFISIDFMKNVIAGREDDMKKNLNIAIKRIIFCVVLFLVPTIVNVVIAILDDAGVGVVTNFNECIEMAQDDTDDSDDYGSGGSVDDGISDRPSSDVQLEDFQ